jgi:hypothetical protein
MNSVQTFLMTGEIQKKKIVHICGEKIQPICRCFYNHNNVCTDSMMIILIIIKTECKFFSVKKKHQKRPSHGSHCLFSFSAYFFSFLLFKLFTILYEVDHLLLLIKKIIRSKNPSPNNNSHSHFLLLFYVLCKFFKVIYIYYATNTYIYSSIEHKQH